MQFTTIFTMLAAAMTAAALPSSSSVNSARDGDSGDVCSQDQTIACCNNTGLVGLECITVAVIGIINEDTCEGGDVYCCNQSNSEASNAVLLDLNVDVQCSPINVLS